MLFTWGPSERTGVEVACQKWVEPGGLCDGLRWAKGGHKGSWDLTVWVGPENSGRGLRRPWVGPK